MAVGYGMAKGLRQTSTNAERLLWMRLRNRQIADAKFRRQQPVGPYIVDLVCMERRLVIELDGGQHAEQEAEDAARTAYLESRGFRVLRYWNNQVFGETEAVLQSIYEALAQAATPHPALSRKGRGRMARLANESSVQAAHSQSPLPLRERVRVRGSPSRTAPSNAQNLPRS